MGRPIPNAELCVVVVNYRTPDMVIDCLKTAVPQLRALGGKLVLVDNASADDSVERLGKWIEDEQVDDCVHLIASPVNGGFAAGNNLGIQSCEADFYLLLNSDTLVREGAFETLLRAARAEPQVGLVSPRLEWPDGTPQESCFRYHRPMSELIRSAGSGVVTRLLATYDVPLRVTETRSFPEWTSFACVLIRREVLERIGLLDEGYFMYFEDVEFSYRAREAGFRILHEPAARVVHLRGGSAPVKKQARLRKRLPRYFYESRTRYFHALYGRSGLLAANLLWSLGWSVSSCRDAVQPQYQSPVAQSQWRDIWTNFWSPHAAYTHPGGGKRS
jgi:GT2 family glycosyltransferase